MIMYYDWKGNPLDMEAWAELIEHSERRVRQTRLWWGLVFISTVYLGLDHDFMYGMRDGEDIDQPNPHPLIFETMAFIGKGVDQMRYSTEEEARAGHAEMVRMYYNPINVFKTWRQGRS